MKFKGNLLLTMNMKLARVFNTNFHSNESYTIIPLIFNRIRRDTYICH